jgi:hypothetical protein
MHKVAIQNAYKKNMIIADNKHQVNHMYQLQDKKNQSGCMKAQHSIIS